MFETNNIILRIFARLNIEYELNSRAIVVLFFTTLTLVGYCMEESSEVVIMNNDVAIELSFIWLSIK